MVTYLIHLVGPQGEKYTFQSKDLTAAQALADRAANNGARVVKFEIRSDMEPEEVEEMVA